MTWWFEPFSVQTPKVLQRKPAGKTRKDPRPVDCRELFASVCETRGKIHDPTGSVDEDSFAELESHRRYEELAAAHPNESVSKITARFIEDSYTRTKKRRMKQALRWTKKTMEKLIRDEPDTSLSKLDRKRMVREIHRVELGWPDPDELTPDQKEILHRPLAHYIRTRDSLQIILGGGYVRSTTSWFNLVFTLAHEIAHAIDPCEQKKKGWVADTSLVYPRLNRCFAVTGLLVEQNIYGPQPKASTQECGRTDQRPEVFADWLAGRVTALALKEFSQEFDNRQLEASVKNAVRDLCTPGPEDPHDLAANAPDEHPSQRIRIELLFARNPMIREVLSCEPQPPTERYCAFDSL
ncbi:MAG: hypothetical protein JNL01_06505 [Bdellovibrionales bacterium]|nr:hypothetical protein [Bdellovibrionales bacterium]